ncbi:ribosome recycling factor [Thermoflexus sp.]|uniref:ribosome recycling factor n=1 Tax=Thermoflexus sp. TaxID=1969742 RepID=UPI0025EBDD08|nr:ribosome recycling factor [Thermoflexus sp.]MCS7351598.1 ribosome recycling factor [Thermoflexus sp.]MCX7689752.1 ribosome recycling factor [Thermoflexus sp.]MDW8181056.1 ribosome recycling factor [Anaerolineae bacterium]
MIPKQVFRDAEERMRKAIRVFEDELKGIRTGRASPALVERIPVEYYGTQVPLEQLAIIRAPEPNLLTIQPYDPKALQEIERAILKSDLGLTPSNDGRIIRLVLPRLTEQRRQELVKLVHKRLEETRIAIRNIRRDVLEELRTRHKNKEMSDDELEEAREEVQKLTDRYIEEAEKVAQAKEKEIMSF